MPCCPDLDDRGVNIPPKNRPKFLPIWPYHLKLKNIATTWNECDLFFQNNQPRLTGVHLYCHLAFCTTTFFLCYRVDFSFSLFGCVLLSASLFSMYFFLLKAWLIIQPLKKDFPEMPSPQKMFAKCFIPVLNLYWMLVIFSSLETGLRIIATIKYPRKNHRNKFGLLGCGVIVPYLLSYQYIVYFINPNLGQYKFLLFVTQCAMTTFYISCKILINAILDQEEHGLPSEAAPRRWTKHHRHTSSQLERELTDKGPVSDSDAASTPPHDQSRVGLPDNT